MRLICIEGSWDYQKITNWNICKCVGHKPATVCASFRCSVCHLPLCGTASAVNAGQKLCESDPKRLKCSLSWFRLRHDKNRIVYDFFSFQNEAGVGQWERERKGGRCCDEPNCVQFTFNWTITRLFIRRNVFRDSGLNPLSHIWCLFIGSPCDRQAICEAAPLHWWKTNQQPCARRLFTSVFHPVMGLEDILTL